MPTILTKALSASAFAAGSIFVNSANASSNLSKDGLLPLGESRTSAVTQYGEEAPILSVPLKRVMDKESRGAAASSSLRRHYFTKTDVLGVYGAAYMAEVTIGNSKNGQEPQVVDLLLDTGSFEMWVNPVCANSALPELCNSFGRYDPSKSSTAKTFVDTSADAQFTVEYGSGATKGKYFVDDIFISGTQIRDQKFGVANDTDSVWFGVLGLGRGMMSGYSDYPLVVDSVVSQQHSSSKLFSMDLGSQREPGAFATGQLIFGGVDANKFSGKLAKVAIDESDPHYKVMLHGLSVHQPGSQSAQSIQSAPNKEPLPVVVDSGTTVSLLPRKMVEQMASQFPGATPDKSGGYTVDCKYQKQDGHVDFAFESTTIRVSYNDFVWNSGDGCSLGVAHDPELPVNILGDSFLRGAYVVYDQENKAVFMANYESCSAESALVAIPAGVDAAAQVQGNCNGKGQEDSKMLEMRHHGGDHTEKEKETHTSTVTSISSTPIAVFNDVCSEDDSKCVPGVEAISMKTFTETSTTTFVDEEVEEGSSPMTASEPKPSSITSSQEEALTAAMTLMTATTTTSSETMAVVSSGSSSMANAASSVTETVSEVESETEETGTATAELAPSSTSVAMTSNSKATATAKVTQLNGEITTINLAIPMKQPEQQQVEEHEGAGHLPQASSTATATAMVTKTVTAEEVDEDCETQTQTITVASCETAAAANCSPGMEITTVVTVTTRVSSTVVFEQEATPSPYDFPVSPTPPPIPTTTSPMFIKSESPTPPYPQFNNASAFHILGSSMMNSSRLIPTPTPSPISASPISASPISFSPSPSLSPSASSSPSPISASPIAFSPTPSQLQNPSPTEIQYSSPAPPLPYVAPVNPSSIQGQTGPPYTVPGPPAAYFNSTNTHGTAVFPISGSAVSWVTKPAATGANGENGAPATAISYQSPMPPAQPTNTSVSGSSSGSGTGQAGGNVGNGNFKVGGGMPKESSATSSLGGVGIGARVVMWVGLVVAGGAFFGGW